jgi:HEAT repeat protein
MTPSPAAGQWIALANLNDPEKAIREEARRTLEEMGDEAVDQLLVPAVKQDPSLAPILASLRSQLQGTNVPPPLWRSCDLGRIPTGVTSVLLVLLHNRRPGVRAAAAELLGAFWDGRAFLPLVEAARDGLLEGSL